MQQAFPDDCKSLIPLKVLRVKKTTYGNFSSNYLIQAAVGVTDCDGPLICKIGCGLKDVKRVDVYEIHAAEYGNKLTITFKGVPNQ